MNYFCSYVPLHVIDVVGPVCLCVRYVGTYALQLNIEWWWLQITSSINYMFDYVYLITKLDLYNWLHCIDGNTRGIIKIRIQILILLILKIASNNTANKSTAMCTNITAMIAQRHVHMALSGVRLWPIRSTSSRSENHHDDIHSLAAPNTY